MGLKGYLIEKYNHMTNAYTCNRLVSEAKALGIDLRIVGIHDMLVTKDGVWNVTAPLVEDAADGKSSAHVELLERRDFVINRYKWGKLKDEINALADRTYNPIDAYRIYINKYEQVRRLHSEEFLIPKYLLSTAMISFQALTQMLGTPVVAKGLESSMGEQIRLIQREEDLQSLLKEYGMEKEWLFEEFIGTSHGRDMRFYSIRGKAVACMQRKSAGDFRANVALGASVEKLEITERIQKIAKDVYDQTGLDFLGIDLLYGTEKPYFCEINVMPGIEGIEKASGENVARMILTTIQEDFKRR